MIDEKEIAYYRSNIIDKYIIEVETSLEAQEVVNLKKYRERKSLKSNPDYKRCTRCGEYKRLTEFYKNPLKKQGVFDYCKKCARERAKQRREQNGHARTKADVVHRQRRV